MGFMIRKKAIERLKRCPNPHGGECEVEIRQSFEAGILAQR
jgi:hypothetical protein